MTYGPIVSVWCECWGGGGGGAYEDVHADDFVIDSDWLVWSLTNCKECCCEELTSLSADHPNHSKLFRTYVSKKAAGKADAVLEGVGLDTATIKACEAAHRFNDEKIVQEGLIKWLEGLGTQPPTWNVLIAAMGYAEIAQQDIRKLKQELGH